MTAPLAIIEAMAREIARLQDRSDTTSTSIATAVLELVGPKPLVWGWNGAMYRSRAINGIYRVVKIANKTNDKFMVIFLDAESRSYTLGYVDGHEAAQAAAQAHADAAHWANTKIGGE